MSIKNYTKLNVVIYEKRVNSTSDLVGMDLKIETKLIDDFVKTEDGTTEGHY